MGLNLYTYEIIRIKRTGLVNERPYLRPVPFQEHALRGRSSSKWARLFAI